jgi:hypothetical protein
MPSLARFDQPQQGFAVLDRLSFKFVFSQHDVPEAIKSKKRSSEYIINKPYLITMCGFSLPVKRSAKKKFRGSVSRDPGRGRLRRRLGHANPLEAEPQERKEAFLKPPGGLPIQRQLNFV